MRVKILRKKGLFFFSKFKVRVENDRQNQEYTVKGNEKDLSISPANAAPLKLTATIAWCSSNTLDIPAHDNSTVSVELNKWVSYSVVIGIMLSVVSVFMDEKWFEYLIFIPGAIVFLFVTLLKKRYLVVQHSSI